MEKREFAHKLIDSYFDKKNIIVKDKIHGIHNWTSIYNNYIWTYLEKFCENVEKYKIIEDENNENNED